MDCMGNSKKMRFNSSYRTYIIAEAGVNHNGKFSEAIKLVDAAKFAGADAVKFQTYKSETRIPDLNHDIFKILKKCLIKFSSLINVDGLTFFNLKSLYSDKCRVEN